ncbi:hypothetical protein Ddc_04738 [Ditylenchus destructor]|nr:hypothetical protein Ddc_04738 [Ditylenchus destructor]
MNFADGNENNIFFLGLAVLFGWMIVIILCASPQLFRDFIQRHLCCCMFKSTKLDQYNSREEKVRLARERVRSASKSFVNTSLVSANPSVFLLQQVMGPGQSYKYAGAGSALFDPIPEESRCTSLQPGSVYSEESDRMKASSSLLPMSQTVPGDRVEVIVKGGRGNF